MSDITLESIKLCLKRIDNCVPSNEFSIQQDIKDMMNIVTSLDEGYYLGDEFFDTFVPKSQARQYLTGDFLYFLCKYLIEFKQFQLEENQRNAVSILEYSVRSCVKILKEQPDQIKAYETLRFIIDPERFFYRGKNQYVLNVNRFSSDIELTENQTTFLDNLQEGDQVDALKADNKLSVIDWSRGTIISINNNANTILVEWIGEQGEVRSIQKYSWDIAPFKSRVPDSEWDWKSELKVGDIIDCPDENVWYNATVVRRDGDKIRVGFRHYDEKGLIQDEVGRYFGWSSQYDEDVPLYSPKIQKRGKFSKAFCKYASLSNAEESIKDHNDHLFNIGHKKLIYAVPRLNTKYQRKSLIMTRLIQIFGDQGGFQLLYDRLADQEKLCQIETLTQIMMMFGQMHEMLHRQFVMAYVPKVLEAVTKNLVNSPDSNLRNFSYQRINDTLQGLGNLCKRYYSLKDKNEIVDKLDMDIAMRCFKSDFLERQIHGLKAIQDLIRRTKENQGTMSNSQIQVKLISSDTKYLCVEIIVDWINDNRVFESIYMGQNSSYIVQRSSDFLKFMLDEKLVSLQQLEMIVKSAKKGEMEDKQAIYKILKDVSQSFSREQLLFVIQTTCEGQPQQLTKDDLDLLQDITKYNYRFKEDFNALFVKFYWILINQGDKLQSDILDTIITYYVDLINSFDYRPQREANLKSLGDNIQLDRQVTLMLKVVQKFIDKLEVQPSSWDQYTRDVALTQLQTENHIIDALFHSIATYKVNKTGEESTYIDEIAARTEFIQYFYSNIQSRQYTLDFETVGRLWDELVERAKCPQERDILYKWFSSNDLARGVQIDDIKRFFNQRMTKDIASLTEEGFNCLQSLVTLINISSNTFKTCNGHDDTHQSPQYKFDGELTEIFGFDTMQEITCQANDYVSSLSRQFMISLIKNHQDPADAYDEYLRYAFGKLNSGPWTHRILLMIEDVLDESEWKGIGDLTSIGALSQGEPIQMDFLNQCTQGWSVQKKFSLAVNENSTVFELRLLVQQKIKAPWDGFNFVRNGGVVVNFQHNGLIIRDLRVKRNEVFQITKRQTFALPEADILDRSNQLTVEAKRVFLEVFREFSSEGLMNKEQCAQYVTACTGNTCLPDDHQIARTFESYDKDKDGYLTEENFNEFYLEASKSKKSTVWLNLRMLHYRNDLVRGDRVPVELIDCRTLPRYLISRRVEQMQTLFGLLESDDVRLKAWSLLRRLPPSPQIVMALLRETNKSMLECESEYKLLYNLYIFEYLMDAGQHANLSLLLEGGDPQQQQQQHLPHNWSVQFVEHGGFDEFMSTFWRFNDTQQQHQTDVLHKQILSFLLKILSNFLSALYHPTTPFLYHTMRLSQSHTLTTQELQQHQDIPSEFLDLVASLSALGRDVEPTKLYKQLLKMIHELIVQKEDVEAEDRQIIEYAMMVVLCCALHNKQLLELEHDDTLLTIMIEGLLTNKSQNLRQFFGKQAFLLAYQSQRELNCDAPTQRLLQQLVGQLGECSRPQNANCSEQYYELLSVLVENCAQCDFVNYEELAVTLVRTLKSHESSESLQRAGPDKLIVGLLTLLTKIVVMRGDVRESLASKESLIEVIFNECLFACTKTVKCKSRESRSAAFTLINALCVDSAHNTQHLIEACLAPLAQQIPTISTWNHVPSNDQRCNGYAGIKNLGCICYMIAMLQQFFLTPTFRYAILMADDGEPVDMQPRPKDGVLVDDNVFHQFQKMFAFLESSDRLDYNPIDFCFAFKDFSGDPVDVTIQQDSQEFLNMIFDRLEHALKGTPFKNILEGVYGGKTVTQLTCSECKHVRNKEENFFNISLPIKNQKNLQECFDKFISEEVISDYRCEGCDKKVDVTKRQMLQQMPNVLILHLQRIVFNLDTLTNEKINSRVDFPQQLDLSQYLVEASMECSRYRLVGVVVHFGAAEFGHYFSYIDINRDEEAFSREDDGDQKWFEFNDSKVKEFKVSNLENECFGGACSTSDDDVGWWKTNRENSQNAYVLVYEKMLKTPIKLACYDTQHCTAFQTQFNLRFLSTTPNMDGTIVAEVDYYALPRYVPPHLSQLVAHENQQFQLERSLYDPQFFTFLKEICDQPTTVNEQMLTTLIPYTFDLLARAYENRQLEPLLDNMKRLLRASPSFSLQFLDKLFTQRANKTIDLLLCCPEAQTRLLVAQLLAQTLNANIDYHQLTLLDSDSTIEEATITKCLTTLLDLMKDQVPKNWVRFDQYFQFWRDFAEGGHVQVEFLLRRNILTQFLDFMLEGNSPLKLQEKRIVMGNPYYQPNFASLFEVCLKLITYCRSQGKPLTQDDLIMMYSSRLIERLIKNLLKQPLISPFFVDMSRDNELYSEILCSCVLRSMNQSSQEEFIPLTQLVVKLLTLTDCLQPKRIEWILGYASNDPKFTKSVDQLPQFGIYGFSALEEDIFKYPSPLHYAISLLDTIVQNLGQYKRNDNLALLAISALTQAMVKDTNVREYVLRLPAISCTQTTFISCFEPFLESYQLDSKRYYFSNFAREELTEECLKWIAALHQLVDFAFVPANPSYVIGNTLSVKQSFILYALLDGEKLFVQQDLDPELYDGVLLDPAYDKICIIQENTYTVATCPSKPNGLSNDAFPQEIVRGHHPVKRGTQTSQFIEPRSNTNHTTYNYNSFQHKQQQPTQQETQQQDHCDEDPIEGYEEADCIRTISITNLQSKSVHFVIKLVDKEGLFYTPQSKLQKIMKPNLYMVFVTLMKKQRQTQWIHIGYEIEHQLLEGHGDALFISPLTQHQRALFAYR